MIAQDSLCRTGLEVYKTNDTNIEGDNSQNQESSQTTTQETSNTNDDSSEKINYSSNDSNKDKEGYVLHNGEIEEIYYTDNIIDNDYDYDYEDISNNGSVQLTEVDQTRFYKGTRVLLKKAWEGPGENLTWDDLEDCLLGFITEQKYSEKGVDIKISGMTKLLEQEKQFSFSQRKRSEVLKEMIESAGLKADIDVTGLNDEVIDYSNVSSGSGTSGNSSVADIAQEICQGCNTDEEKANAIHKHIAQNVEYPATSYSNHKKCPREVLNSKISNCCDRARTGHELGNGVGLTSRGVHGPNHVWVQYQINGQWVDSDPSHSRPNLGSVMNGMKMDRVWQFPSC